MYYRITAMGALTYQKTIGKHNQNYCASIAVTKNHADVVGAINVLERGCRLLAFAEMLQSGRSKKQDPTQATR